MNKMKFFISLVFSISILIGQVGGVLAAPALQESGPLTGTVKSITLETDPNTGITIVIIEINCTNQDKQILRTSQEAAVATGLVTLDGDGNPLINKSALGKPIEIDPVTVIPDQPEKRNPVGNALATFFSDVPGMDYETIMVAHGKGVGFGVIAQTLWLTKQVKGNKDDFHDFLYAKETGDYTGFVLEDGMTPKNWGQLQKAVLDGKKVDKPGNAASNQNNGTHQNKDKDKDKNKGNGNGGGNGNGNNGNGNGKDKDK